MVAAKIIAQATGSDLFKIEQKNPYAKDYNTCIAQAQRDFQMNARPELAVLPDNLEQYDEIYLGYPNYWGTMPMAVYTFLEAFDFTKKQYIHFVHMKEADFHQLRKIFQMQLMVQMFQMVLQSPEVRWRMHKK